MENKIKELKSYLFQREVSMKIFSYEKFKKDCEMNNIDPEEHFWAKIIDGQEVDKNIVLSSESERIGTTGFEVDDDWCEEV